MSDKDENRLHHRRPPLSRIGHKPRRSRSMSNELQREPLLQPPRTHGLELSVATNLGTTSMSTKESRVAKLIKQFEESESTDNVPSSIKDKSLSSTLSSPFAYSASIRVSSNNVCTSQSKQNKISTTVSPRIFQPPIPSLPSIETLEISVHHGSRLISKTKTSGCVVIPKETSVDPMTSSAQGSSSFLEEFIPPEPNYTIDDPNPNTYILSQPPLDDEGVDFDVTLETNLSKSSREVYETEFNYVRKLYVLSYKLPAQIKKTCQKDENLIKRFHKIYKPLLGTIKRLYDFHHQVILPHLEQYQTGHCKKYMWSIIQEYFQTIEDLYRAYYIVYDENQDKIKQLCTSHPLIHKAMVKCQVHLGNLCPISELNCANQRLLHYILLMTGYMEHLEKNSDEYEHTRFIHDELARIAGRFEEELVVSSSQLNQLKQRVDNKLECFTNQQLLWHGSLKKQSARKRTDIGQRYVILFSECLLVCEKSGNKLQIKRQLPIIDIFVDIIQAKHLAPTPFHSTNGQPISSIVYYPFRVSAEEKSYEFLVDKESHRERWVNKIRQAKENFERRYTTIELRPSFHHSEKPQLGLRAPVLVYDIDVTRCQICHNRFGLKIISSDRHHCRSCGCAVCSACSTNKLTITYCKKEGEVRVCDTCYQHFTGINKTRVSSAKITRNPDKSILFGDFRYSSSNSIIWIELQEDYQLYIYGAKLDQVEDFSINLNELREISFIKETRTFILNGKDKTYRFSIELNHQITYPENDYIDDDVKNTNNKSLFYANLWYNTMQLAHSKTLPPWYTRKRDSADSGIGTL